MADTEALPPPVEIPWQLASTTQPLAAGEPAQTSLSLFFFEPEEDALTRHFPDERLVFIKLTASVSPASFPAELSKTAAEFLGEGIPCLHLLLDLKVRLASGESGTIRPYFHAAAPLNRRMIQTGVVGAEAFEGDADAQMIGKSGSQMAESLRSHSNTVSGGASLGFSVGPFSVGGSVRSTSTDLSSDRAVSQVVDTTMREASQERRELISHTTRVENVLTLLSAKYVGTPHLSFSLAPRPLQLLSLDPADPNLWFQQLLARRSSGIEGIQEFTAVVVVPRDADFCINARLRRVCLLDSPPGPLSFDERFNGSLLQLARMVQYLNRVYPAGTPLDDLDVDIIGSLSGGNFRRPVVELWALRLVESLVVALVVSPGATAGVAARGSANYKHMLEVWLDTLRGVFLAAKRASLVERGVLFGDTALLDPSSSREGEAAGGGLGVSGSTAAVSPLFRVKIPRGAFEVGGVTATAAVRDESTRSRALETVTRWNAMEHRLTTLLSNQGDLPEEPLAAGDPQVLGVLLDGWAKPDAADARNLGFEQAAELLKLPDDARRLLKAAGAEDLAGIARALKFAPEVERHNVDVRRLRAILKERRIEGAPPETLKRVLGAREGGEVVAASGAAVGGRTRG